MQIESAFLAKNPYVPRYLYKYREFKDTHLSALRSDLLYMSSPDRFNDPYDSTIFFDPSRFMIDDISAQDFITNVKKMEIARRSGMPWRPEALKNPIRQDEWRQKIMTDLLKDEPEHLRQKLIAIIDGFFNKHQIDMREFMRARLRSGFSVLSLASDPTSITMWSHYSNSHKGFCIEYDFSKLSPDDLNRRLCYPVFYRKKPTNATRYLANTGTTDFNNLFGIYLCLLKGDTWSYEKEWRIVHPIGPDHANREIRMPETSAIILGINAKLEDIKKIDSYCRARNITLKRATRSDAKLEIIIL